VFHKHRRGINDLARGVVREWDKVHFTAIIIYSENCGESPSAQSGTAYGSAIVESLLTPTEN
jgi:hypothetical protein